MKAYLILQDGKIFEGESIGKVGEVIGEVVFTTGMVGYMETLTDPNYYGQLVTHTFPLIGNYGAINEDVSCKPSLSGYIVRELCEKGSNFRLDSELDVYLKENNVIGIEGIDTRELTRILRDNGVCNAMISDNKHDLASKLLQIKNFVIKDALKNTTDNKTTIYNEKGKYKVALIDYGNTNNIIDDLTARDCAVIKLPHTVTADEINSLEPNGIVLSDGAGNPNEDSYEINEIKKLLNSCPMLGISLGHQIMALANGGKVTKLKYGHRGASQPVKDLGSMRVFTTSQNHGYSVTLKSLSNATQTFVNANDKTNEGLEYANGNLSVQFHPLFGGGSQDTMFIIDQFIKLMSDKRGEQNA